MSVTRREALLQIGAAGALGAGSAGTAGERVLLPGVDRYRVVEPVFEGVRVILSKRGEKWSPAYLQGISGAAFRIGGPCPCAPTCCGPTGPEGLAATLGYACELLPFPARADPQKRLAEVLERLREEIRQGRPALVFHAFTNAEWDVVCGFDAGRKTLCGRGSYAGLKEYAVADEGRMLTCQDICGIVGAMLIGQKTGRYEARKAEIGALREAVRYARSTREKVPYPGLQCYDRWIEAFRAEPPRRPDFGQDGYTSGVFRSTQRAAADFLRELKPTYPAASSRLERAARAFAREAAALDRFRETLFPQKAGATPEPGELRRRAVELLTEARDAYRQGIEGIEAALPLVAAARPPSVD